MKRIVILAWACLPFVFSSCKKDDDPSKTELLTNKNWVMTAATVDPSIAVPGGGTTNNWYNQMAACLKDDIMNFKADKTFTLDEGASKCNVGDPQTLSGTWIFNPTETVVSITRNGSTMSFTIKSLTGNKMVGSYQTVNGGVTYTVEETYEAK